MYTVAFIVCFTTIIIIIIIIITCAYQTMHIEYQFFYKAIYERVVKSSCVQMVHYFIIHFVFGFFSFGARSRNFFHYAAAHSLMFKIDKKGF